VVGDQKKKENSQKLITGQKINPSKETFNIHRG
jgi:hypothetical protein